MADNKVYEEPVLKVRKQSAYGWLRFTAVNPLAKELRKVFAYKKDMKSFSREQLGVLSRAGVRIEVLPDEPQKYW